jgi:broad specificity phosphatase PhoE
MKRFLAVGIWLVSSVCLLASCAHSQVRTIFLVRHADKVSDAYDSPLSDRGLERAKCLANTLADAHIEQILVSDLQRTQQTAAPIAARLGLKPMVVPITALEDLVQAIQSGKAATVLVVWHGGTLPKLLHALGAPDIAPISEPEYDRFFVLTLSGDSGHPDTRFTALRYCDCAR